MLGQQHGSSQIKKRSWLLTLGKRLLGELGEGPPKYFNPPDTEKYQFSNKDPE